MTWAVGPTPYELWEDEDGVPALHVGADGTPREHDYDLDELRQALVRYTLHVMHDPPGALVGEFRDVAGHPIFVRLREPRPDTLGSRIAARAGHLRPWSPTAPSG
ncbi:MAG TPA: hypothetical protein QGF05_02030 [Dehalococcoidia bacterium]|nr:hypothetical protein [Dehalococcoidia bacterium]